MSTSSERFYLGGLIEDLDKDLSSDELDISNDRKTNNSSCEETSSNDKPLPNSNIIVTSSLQNYNVFKFEQQENDKDIMIFTKNNILSAFTSQKNTKQLQKNLINKKKEIFDKIIYELKDNFRNIIKDKNGNYFCSDLIKACNKEQRIKILEELSPFLSEDCCDEFGTYPIQNLFEISSSEEEYKLLISSFNDMNKLLLACINSNGTFVIQKLIIHIPEKSRTEFNFNFVKFISVLSRDMYGLSVVKKFINYTKNELLSKYIFNIIITDFMSISNNQYGNYLIQYLLEKWWKTSEGIILKKLIISKFKVLSGNHYSAYICRLFFKLCNDSEKNIFLSYLKEYKIKGKGGSQQIKIPPLRKILPGEKEKNKFKSENKI